MIVWERDRDKNLKRAIECLEQARGLDYTHAAVHLGQLLEEQYPDRAIKYYEIGVEKHNPYCALFKGMLQERLNQLNEAQETFRVGLEELGSPHCAHKLGRLRRQRGDQEGAIAAYQGGIRLQDALSAFDLAKIWRERAHAMPPPPVDEQRRLLLESAANLRKALNWGEIGAAVNLGDVLLEIDDIAGAREAFTAGMELGHPVAAFKLGGLAVREQDYELAQEALERCAALADDWPVKTKDDEAIQALGPQALYELARLFEMLGRPAAAKRSYRRAHASESGVAVAPAALPAPVQVVAAQPATVKEHSGQFMSASLLRLGKVLQHPIGLLRRPKPRRKVDDATTPTPGSA
jgi:tetratricopeptide (TPR) repeat protein